jgi:hypothetical protein
MGDADLSRSSSDDRSIFFGRQMSRHSSSSSDDGNFGSNIVHHGFNRLPMNIANDIQEESKDNGNRNYNNMARHNEEASRLQAELMNETLSVIMDPTGVVRYNNDIEDIDLLSVVGMNNDIDASMLTSRIPGNSYADVSMQQVASHQTFAAPRSNPRRIMVVDNRSNVEVHGRINKETELSIKLTKCLKDQADLELEYTKSLNEVTELKQKNKELYDKFKNTQSTHNLDKHKDNDEIKNLKASLISLEDKWSDQYLNETRKLKKEVQEIATVYNESRTENKYLKDENIRLANELKSCKFLIDKYNSIEVVKKVEHDNIIDNLKGEHQVNIDALNSRVIEYKSQLAENDIKYATMLQLFTQTKNIDDISYKDYIKEQNAFIKSAKDHDKRLKDIKHNDLFDADAEHVNEGDESSSDNQGDDIFGDKQSRRRINLNKVKIKSKIIDDDDDIMIEHIKMNNKNIGVKKRRDGEYVYGGVIDNNEPSDNIIMPIFEYAQPVQPYQIGISGDRSSINTLEGKRAFDNVAQKIKSNLVTDSDQLLLMPHKVQIVGYQQFDHIPVKVDPEYVKIIYDAAAVNETIARDLKRWFIDRPQSNYSNWKWDEFTLIDTHANSNMNHDVLSDYNTRYLFALNHIKKLGKLYNTSQVVMNRTS